MKHVAPRLLKFLCLSGACFAISANAGIVRLGLWELESTTQSNAHEITVLMAKKTFSELPPEKREAFKSKMLSKGIDIDQEGKVDPPQRKTQKVCMSKEMADQVETPVDPKICKVERSQTPDEDGAIEVSYHCDAPKYDLEGKVRILSSKSFSTTDIIKKNLPSGELFVSTSTSNAKWLSDECGDVQPVEISK